MSYKKIIPLGLRRVLLTGMFCTAVWCLDGSNAYGAQIPVEAVSQSGTDIGEFISSEQLEALKNKLKDKIESGELDTPEGIRKAIDNAIQEYNITIPEDTKEKIVDKIDELSGDSEEIADRIIDEAKKQFIDAGVDKVKKGIRDSFMGFWRDLKNHASGLFNKFLRKAVQ